MMIVSKFIDIEAYIKVEGSEIDIENVPIPVFAQFSTYYC